MQGLPLARDLQGPRFLRLLQEFRGTRKSRASLAETPIYKFEYCTYYPMLDADFNPIEGSTEPHYGSAVLFFARVENGSPRFESYRGSSVLRKEGDQWLFSCADIGILDFKMPSSDSNILYYSHDAITTRIELANDPDLIELQRFDFTVDVAEFLMESIPMSIKLYPTLAGPLAIGWTRTIIMSLIRRGQRKVPRLPIELVLMIVSMLQPSDRYNIVVPAIEGAGAADPDVSIQFVDDSGEESSIQITFEDEDSSLAESLVVLFDDEDSSLDQGGPAAASTPKPAYRRD